MAYSTPEQLSFPPVAGQTLRADFEGGALSSDFGVLLEAIRKPCSNVMPVSSSFLAVVKCRVTVVRKPVQHKMYITNLDHSGT
jgi:hypothetical protein